ncbi:GSAP isoform 8 [Pan troglodytes]|uniref:GSAP isoform 8 n=1 Tax=Pan troglodytes TaxID=9598 RepID=A0A2J8JGS1_PANTR|nr:GSAP isoform 8 [Pan troglodytes]
MALRLVADFDLGKDVLPWLRAQRAVSEASGAGSGGAGVLENDYESLHVLNVERNGNIIYTYKKSRSILKCIQFYADERYNLMFEVPLDISLSNSGFKLVNFGCDYHQDRDKFSKHLTLCVFTNHTGHSKTFTTSLENVGSHVTKGITFLNLDYYVAVYLPGHFFHLLNVQHPDLICHNLFLTGNNEMIDMLPHCPLQSLSGSLVLDCCSGKLYRALLSQSSLLQLLQNTCLDCEKMAALHCALYCGQGAQFLEGQEIPGITLVTEDIALPLMKVLSFKGYWEKLNSNLEYVKYAKPHFHYNNSVVRREWHNLISEEEEDSHQRLLMGLMVSELKDHFLRHLQGVEKKKIEQMVLDYISKLLDLICHIVETSWRKHNLHSWVLHFNSRGSAAEFAVFHIMTRILEATNSLFLPLPPGFHTLHTILGVQCLPLHNLLHCIDSGVLLLTETAVIRLMKDLDNTEKNEKLKFSIIVRLPPLIGQKICRLWDHPMSSNIISRNHVTRLLQNYKKQPRNSMINKSSFSVEFLPLNYFIEILTDIESSNQALYPFEGHDNVDAEFVEEAALKHTAMLLGL